MIVGNGLLKPSVYLRAVVAMTSAKIAKPNINHAMIHLIVIEARKLKPSLASRISIKFTLVSGIYGVELHLNEQYE